MTARDLEDRARALAPSAEVAAGGVPVAAAALVAISSACCIGPLAVVLSALGLSVGTALAIEGVVGPFRPLILGATAVLLAVGFWLSYRRAGAGCGDGKSCARPAARVFGRAVLWLATALFLLLIYYAYVHPNLDVLFGIY